MVNWTSLLTILLAIIGASLIEHMVIAPRMVHSPAKALPAMSAMPETSADYVKKNFPNAVTV